MSDRKPQPGDRVRVTQVGRVLDETGSIEYEDDGVIEVIEPADDPSRHLVGTVMRGTEDTSRDNVVVRIARTAEFQWISVTNGLWYEHNDLIGFEVTGSVPGTPAAEQNPVPPAVLARVREMLNNGRKIRAVKALREACVGLGLKEAKTYAESLPEWAAAERAAEARLRAAVLDDDEPAQTSIDPHEPVVLVQAETPREPRVFLSDGPEPPADVKALEWLDIQEPGDQYCYLVRVGSGWLWSDSAALQSFTATPGTWKVAVRSNDGKYREVLPS